MIYRGKTWKPDSYAHINLGGNSYICRLISFYHIKAPNGSHRLLVDVRPYSIIPSEKGVFVFDRDGVKKNQLTTFDFILNLVGVVPYYEKLPLGHRYKCAVIID